MSKFQITKFDVTESIDSAPIISMDIVVHGGVSLPELKTLRRIIEGEDRGSDWCRTYVSSCRGNGKLNYFSDWARNIMDTAGIAEAVRFGIKQVIFNNPATIVFWADGTKTVVKCQDGDTYSPEVGIAMCYMKKALGNKSNFNNTFKKHISIVEKKVVDKPEKKSTKTYAHLDTEAIYRILRVNKWTVKEFAQVVGVDHSSVYHWLKGGGIKKRNISKMVKALHVPEEAIIKEEK